MTGRVNSPDPRPREPAQVFDYVLLALCLLVLACRATIPEGITSVLYAGKNIFATATYNAVLSAVLILSALAWFAVNLCRRQFQYRLSGIEVGLALFVLAGFLAIYAASNKRLAITDFALLTGTFLMAVLLVQLLTSPARVKLVLCVIAALGVMQAYECTDQFFTSNEITIQQYEKDPNAMLERLGVTPGSYRHMLLEHQLYSKDVRGYFTTGNSAGSFALLALAAAVVLLLEKAGNLTGNHEDLAIFVIRFGLAAFIAFGLLLTHSKGAIAAAIIAAIMFVAYRLTAKRLRRHVAVVIVAALMLFVAGVCLVIWYGLAHGRLPGGNSMLVRWQYWTGAARVYAERPLTGVGGANFADFYPHYKIPAAPETVKDPHNFLLSLLTQYGPLGLLGFLAAFFIPAGWIILAGKQSTSADRNDAAGIPQQPRNLVPAFLLVIAAVLLVVRPILLPSEFGDDTAVMFYVISFMFIVPVVIFSIALLLLSLRQSRALTGTAGRAILYCVLIGVLIHNCVDFAIFEPGVLTAFWAIAACLIALARMHRAPKLLGPVLPVRVIALVLISSSAWACLGYFVIPVIRSTEKISRAQMKLDTISSQTKPGLIDESAVFHDAHNLFSAAAQNDPFSPKPCSLDVGVYLRELGQLGRSRGSRVDNSRLEFLLRAEQRALEAIARNDADFKSFRDLAEIYRLLAAYSKASDKQTWLQKAYDSAWKAVERFPGNGRLRLELAQLAEQLGKTKIAIEQYKTAVRIEDAYREQFRQMYPGRKMFSRLGENTYQWANNQLAELRDSVGPK